MIQLMKTRKCNFACGHCMYECDSKGGHMTEEVFAKALSYIKEAGGVHVMGGEPTLHQDFSGMLIRIAAVAKDVRLVTNGSMLQQRGDILCSIAIAAKMCRLMVRISNDRWRSVFITKEQIARAHELVNEAGAAVLSNDMGDKTVYPLGRALHTEEVLDHIFNNLLHTRPAECVKCRYDVWDNLSIDINGDVAPCPHHRSVCGNIITDDMEAVVKNAKAFIEKKILSNPIHWHCRLCGTGRRC